MDEVKKLLNEQIGSNKMLSLLVEMQSISNNQLLEAIKEQRQAIAAYMLTVKTQEECFRKEQEEIRQLAKLNQAQLKAFLDQSNKLLGKSTDEVVVGLANSHLKSKTLTEEDKARRDREGSDFYKSYSERIVSQ
jgi:flagellar biosynthesis chaperone FliJ